jgi:ribonucleotide reductase beta subunit family protein with ferritin-like domain
MSEEGLKIAAREESTVETLDISRFNDAEEPLLKPNLKRLVILPIEYQDIWEMYKNAESSFWTFEEGDVKNDKKDFDGLTKNEQDFLTYILAFFAASDGIVNENLAMRFYGEVQVAEARLVFF